MLAPVEARAPDIVLASASPRRAELLRQLGLRFVIRLAPEIESTDGAGGGGSRPGAPATLAAADALARRLATAKAEAVAAAPEALVIGADTVVVNGGAVLGKPRDPQEAAGMLRQLSGRRHDVITAVAVLGGVRRLRLVDSAATAVWFRPLDEDEISRYVATGEPMDKAGAYGIQGRAGAFVERLEGDYFAVVGLPLATLTALLRRAGVVVP